MHGQIVLVEVLLLLLLAAPPAACYLPPVRLNTEFE